jgi:hypothetical protein
MKAVARYRLTELTAIHRRCADIAEYAGTGADSGRAIALSSNRARVS